MRRVYELVYSEQGSNGKFALFFGKKGSRKRISEWKYDKIWKTFSGIYAIVNNKFYVLIDKNTGFELTPDDEYTFIGDSYFGIRTCKNVNKKSAIMIKNEVVSPWYDTIRFEPGFNVVSSNGLYFLTTGNGCTRISDFYKRIGKFKKVAAFIGSFAEVVGLNGKVGTVNSNGTVGIPCEYKALYNFGTVFKVYHYLSDKGKSYYGIIAINGEFVTREIFDSFEIIGDKLKLTTADGKIVVYNDLGQRVKQ